MKHPIVRILKASCASTVGLVIWGMLFWAVLYEPADVYHALPDGDAIAQRLIEDDAATGTYFYPWPRNTDETFGRFVAQHRSGPSAASPAG